MEDFLIYILGILFILFVITNIHVYKKSTGVTEAPLAFYVFLLAYLVILPLVIAIVFIFALYRQLIKLILKIKHGSQFGGLLGEGDAIYTMENPSKYVISGLMIWEHDKKRYQQSPYETLRQALHNFYFSDPDRFPKFVSTYHNFMGYTYMLKNQVTVDDCVGEMHSDKEKLNRKDVVELITDYTKRPLPKNETVFWQLLVGTQPVDWDENIPGKTYPVLLRLHHSMGDGLSLIKLLVGAFADNPTIHVVSPEAWKTRTTSPSKDRKFKQEKQKEKLKEKILGVCKITWKVLKFFFRSAHVLVLAPTTIYALNFLKANDSNILHVPSLLSGQVLLAFNAEVSKEYVRKVKNIKTKFPGSTFSEILISAFSASIDEYFSKTSSGVAPKNITLIMPWLSSCLELKNLRPGESIDINLKNNFSMLFLRLPLRISPGDGFDAASLISGRLKLVQKESRLVRQSMEYMVNYWMLNEVLAYLPQFMNRLYVDLLHCTVAMSILPGPPKVTFCGGSPVHDVVFWPPISGHIGVMLSVFTYDGRLQIGLTVDKTLISDRNDAQCIVDGIYKHIHMLDEETA